MYAGMVSMSSVTDVWSMDIKLNTVSIRKTAKSVPYLAATPQIRIVNPDVNGNVAEHESVEKFPLRASLLL